MKKDDDRYDFQIVHHFIDLNELTLKRIPVGSSRKYSQSINSYHFRLKSRENHRNKAGSEDHPSQ